MFFFYFWTTFDSFGGSAASKHSSVRVTNYLKVYRLNSFYKRPNAKHFSDGHRLKVEFYLLLPLTKNNEGN